MKLLSKPKSNYHNDYSIATAIVSIYIVTILIAASFIIPAQEDGHFFVGLLKSIFWPIAWLFP